MDTIVLALDDGSVVAGITGDETERRFIRSGHFRYSGKCGDLIIAFTHFPMSTGMVFHGINTLWAATEPTMPRALRFFAGELHQRFSRKNWAGEVLVASPKKIWKIETNFQTREVDAPHAVIGDRASEVKSELATLQKWHDGRLSTPGVVANALTQAWGELGQASRGCRLSRYRFPS